MTYKELLQQRKRRGLQIANSCQVVEKNGVWLVPSQTNPHKVYQVRLMLEGSTCTCEDYASRRIKCKHVFSVEYTIEKKFNADGSITITTTKKVSYPQNWPAYDKAQINQKEAFMKLLYDLCQSIPETPASKTKGRPKLQLRDMVFTSALKVFTTFSLRRFMTDSKAAKDMNYIQSTPHYSSVALYMENPELTPLLNKLISLSALPLKAVETDFSIDSTGFSSSRFVKWFDHKYGKEKDVRVWLKAHVVNGNSTHIIPAVEITDAYQSDTTMLEGLVAETHRNFDIRTLEADKAYSSRKSFDFLDDLGITPYIPFRQGTTGKPRGHTHLWRKMFNYYTFNQEQFLTFYHQRSNAETAFHMIKSKFGDSVRSKTTTAQINEILLKVLCHNICVVIQETYELGIEPNFLGV